MIKLPETDADRRAKVRALCLLGGMACAVRLVYSDAVYLQNTGNAGWIQAIGGMLLALPSLLLLAGTLRMHAGDPLPMNLLKKLVCVVYLPFLSFDSSSWIYSLAESSSYTTFANASMDSLYLAALLAASVMASRGANACGGYARGVLFVVLFLSGLAMGLQYKEMHPVWLTPVLGGGIGTLSRGSLLCGGYASLYSAGIWLFLQSDAKPVDSKELRGIVHMLPKAGVAAMVFLLLYGMLSPNLPYAPHIRSFALERLLTGGGRSTSVHFPSLVSWYIMLLIAAVWAMLSTATCLRLLFPSRSLLFCAAVSALLSIAWTPVRMFWKRGEDLLVFANVIIVTIASLALYLQSYLLKRRKKHAHS